MAHDAYSSIPPPSGPGGAAAPPIPWETPGTPAVSALFQTIQLFVMRPTKAFARMPVSSEFVRPLLYLIIIGWIAAWVSFAWDMAFQGVMQGLIPGAGEQAGMEGLPAIFASGAIGLFTVIFYPVAILIFSFVVSAIIHLFLMLVGGANTGFFATYRALCYASGTASLASLIPLCGWIVDLIWGIVLGIIGLAIAHRTTYGKAALAALLPLVLVCLCVVIGGIIFGAALFEAFGNR